MKISDNVSLEEMKILPNLGIIAPGIMGRIKPSFEREPELSREEEDRIILRVLPVGHLIPQFPPARARLLKAAR